MLSIWNNNLETLKKDFKSEGKKFEFRSEEILDFAKKHYKELKKEDMIPWNGRYVISQAMCITPFSGETLLT